MHIETTGRSALRRLSRAALLLLVSIVAALSLAAVGVGGASAQTPSSSTPTSVSPMSTDRSVLTQVEPDIVHIGFYINDVQDLDLQRHRYLLDFFVWFRWTNPSFNPDKSIEFLNGTQTWDMTRIPATEGPERLSDGSLYFREHILAMFDTNMPLEDYPFDRLKLNIVIEDTDRTTNELIYVLDDPAVELAPSIWAPGYVIGEPFATVAEFSYPNMGETDLGNTISSRVIVTIPLKRPWLPYSMKIFIPFILVSLCAGLVFLVDPEHADIRFGLGISSLLTLIALKWMTDGEMPLMDYLGLVDSLYLLAFAFVTCGLIETAYTTWRHGEVDNSTLRLIGRRTLMIAGPIFVIACAAVLLVHLP